MSLTFEYKEKGIYNTLTMYLNGNHIGDSEWADHDYDISRIIEYTTYKSYSIFKENDKLAYIESFYIEPEFRGKGYSKKLIRKTLALIRNKNYNRHISLIMHPDKTSSVNKNTLLRLYRSFGFKSQYGCKTHWMHIYKKCYVRNRKAGRIKN